MDTGDYVNYSSGNTACQGFGTENYVGGGRGSGVVDFRFWILDFGLGSKILVSTRNDLNGQYAALLTRCWMWKTFERRY